MNQDPRRPILLLNAVAGQSQPDFSKSEFTIRIIPSISPETFRTNRLNPSRSNFQNEEQKPTPLYNNSILSESHFKKHMNLMYHFAQQCPAFVHAAILLRVWTRQRGFDQSRSPNSINSAFCTILMASLFQGGAANGKRILSTQWSSYQLFRVFMEWIAQLPVLDHPVYLSGKALDGDEGDGFTEQAFKNFDIAIVDLDGAMNLAGGISRSEWMDFRSEARKTITMLTDDVNDYFGEIFLERVDQLPMKYDAICMIPKLADECRYLSSLNMHDLGSRYFYYARTIPELLTMALQSRVHVVSSRPVKVSSWGLKETAPKNDGKELMLVFLLDPVQSPRVVDYGPSAEDEKAVAEFKQLWGPKSELRRFKDGSILESVVWEVPDRCGLDGRATIIEMAVKHLLHHHFSISDARIMCNQFFKLLKPSKKLTQSHPLFKEELHSHQPVNVAFDQFVRQLRNLEELPLSIVDIRPGHAGLRYSSVYIPQPHTADQLAKYDTELFPYMEPMDVIVQFESSTRWPNDLAAIQRTKTAFYIKLAELIQENYPQMKACVVQGHDDETDPKGITAYAAGYLEVLSDAGFVYRCRIHHEHELVLLDRALKQPSLVEAEKIIIERALELYQHFFILKPMYTQLVQALVHQHAMLSHTVRLVKRWFASHLLLASTGGSPVSCTNLFSDELVELLCIKVFVEAKSFGEPGSLMAGFTRVLRLLSTFDFRESPLIVPLQSDVSTSPEKTNDIQKLFQDVREKDPLMSNNAMYVVPIVKPSADNAILLHAEECWMKGIIGRDSPSAIVLQRVQALANASLKWILSTSELLCSIESAKLQSRLDTTFTHSFSDYDVVFRLQPKWCASYYQSIRADPKVFQFQEQFKNLVRNTGRTLPASFDPMLCFIEELTVST